MPKKKTWDQGFACGIAISVAYIIKDGYPTFGYEMLREFGYTYEMLEKSGVSEADLEVIKPYIDAEREWERQVKETKYATETG